MTRRLKDYPLPVRVEARGAFLRNPTRDERQTLTAMRGVPWNVYLAVVDVLLCRRASDIIARQAEQERINRQAFDVLFARRCHRKRHDRMM